MKVQRQALSSISLVSLTGAAAVLTNVSVSGSVLSFSLAAAIAGICAVSLVATVDALRKPEMSVRLSSDPNLLAARVLRMSAYGNQETNVAIPARISESGDHQTVLDARQLFTGKPHQYPSVIISGPPGSGKSSLIDSVSAILASRFLDLPATANSSVPCSRKVPLPIDASSWSSEPITAWLESRAEQDFEIARSSVRKWVRDNGVCILIDGIDESPMAFAFIGQIASWSRSHPEIPLVLTTRPPLLLELSNSLPDFSVLELLPLDSAGVHDFLTRRGLAAHRLLPELLHSYTAEEIGRPTILHNIAQLYSHSEMHAESNRLDMPLTAGRILVSASMVPGNDYSLVELSSRTLLPPKDLLPILHELESSGLIELVDVGSDSRYRALTSSERSWSK